MEYLIKSTLILTVLYLSWYILLRNQISPMVQRFLFLIIICLSLILPLVKNPFGLGLEPSSIILAGLFKTYYTTFNQIENHYINLTVPSAYWDFTNLYLIIYFTGFLALILRLVGRLYHILKLIQYRNHHYIKEKKYILLPFSGSPFSFFGFIFLPPHFFNNQDRSLILTHEKVHCRQMHSVDILFAEIFLALHWFNPFAWLLRKVIAENHEYLADQGVLTQGFNPADYQMALLKETIHRGRLALTNYFNQPLIKKRIRLMNTYGRTNYHNFKVIQIIPVLIAILFFMGMNSPVLQSKDMIKFSCPLESGRITAKYGMMMHPFKKEKVKHTGIDIAIGKGTEIYAAAQGTVIETGFDKGAGNYVIIAHNQELSTFYSHLDKILVSEQQAVLQKEIIGLVGSTGLSTAPHLHFEIREAADAKNPEDYIDFSSLKK